MNSTKSAEIKPKELKEFVIGAVMALLWPNIKTDGIVENVV